MDKKHWIIIITLFTIFLIGVAFYRTYKQEDSYGAGSKISDMTETTSVESTAVLPIVSSAGVSNEKITVANLFASMASTTALDELAVTSSTISSIIWSSATGTNTTSTNLYTQNMSFLGATGTGLKISSTFEATSSTLTTLNFINATGTSLNSNVLCIGGTCKTSWSTTSSWYGPIEWTSATGTNTTSTNLYASNLGFVGATGTGLKLTGTFESASSTVTTFNFTSATGNNVGIIGSAPSVYFTDLDAGHDDFRTYADSDRFNLYGGTLQLLTAYSLGSVSLSPIAASAGGLLITNTTATTMFVNGLATFGTATGTTLRFNTGNFAALTVGAQNVCLADGTNCPAGTGVPTLQEVLNEGFEATTTLALYGSFWASNVMATGTLYASSTLISNGTSTAWDVTRLGWTDATGTTLSITGGFSAGSSTVTALNFTNATGSSVYTPLLAAVYGSVTNLTWTNATGTYSTSTNLYASNLGFTGATGTGLDLTGTLSAASTTLTSLNFTNATGASLAVSSILVKGKKVCLETGFGCLPKTLTLWASTSTGSDYLQVGTTSTETFIWPYQGVWTLVEATGTLEYAGAGGTSTQVIVVKENGTARVSMLDRWIHIDPWGLSSDLAMATTTVLISSTNGTVTAGDRITAGISALPTTKPIGSLPITLKFVRTQ